MARLSLYWRSGIVAKLIILAGALFLSCGLCTAVFLAMPTPDSDTPANTTVVVVTATFDGAAQAVAEATQDALSAETSTIAAFPTATEVPATVTAHPTDTPITVTATPRPTHTTIPPTPTPDDAATATAAAEEAAADEVAAELAYRAEMIEIGEEYVLSLEGIAKQSGLASDDPTVIIDNDWKVDTVVYLTMLKLANDRVRGLEPPARFADAHAEMLTAADHFDLSVQYYAEGVDELDANKLDLAATNMQLGNEAVRRAADILGALGS